MDQQLTDYILANRERHYRLAFSYLKNKEDALDIVQESIIKALSKTTGLPEDPRAFHPWFCRIVVNTSLDLLRRQNRYMNASEDEMEGHMGGKSDAYLDLDLQEALDMLATEDKTMIILRFFEDLKLEEVAEIMGLNLNTLKARLYKVLKKLKLELTEEGGLA